MGYDDVYEEMIVAGSKLKIDIFNRTKMIAIEFDGEQHQEFNKFFHQNCRANFYKQKMRDTHKNKWMQINNIELIRVNKKTIGSILSLLKPQDNEN